MLSLKMAKLVQTFIGRRHFGHCLAIIFAVLISSVSATCGHAAPEGERDDIVRGLTYTLEPQPNYPSAKDDAKHLLTDHRPAAANFWRDGTALGWTWRSLVTVAIELPKTTAVSRVRVQAGAKRSGEIYFPSQIFIYGGDGAGGFAFLGASKLSRDADSPQSATLRFFDIDVTPKAVKQILVVVAARSPFIFLGEIEALSASEAPALLPSFHDQKAVLGDAVQRRQDAISRLPDAKPVGPRIYERWAMPLAASHPASDRCVIERIEPWINPGEPARAVPAERPLAYLTGGHAYAAFRITNSTKSERAINVSVGEGQGVVHRVSALAYVQALDYSWVPDVVVPFDSGGVLPADSAMTLLVEIGSESAARWSLRGAINCGSDSLSLDIPADPIGADPTVSPLHGNVWTYLHQPQHVPVVQALKCDADFLARYGVDTATVHPDALLIGRERPTELLRRYFETHRNAARLLLFMDIKDRRWDFEKMSDEDAAKWLRAWWDWVQGVAREARVKGELLLYPIDEPRLDDFGNMRRFRQLIGRAEIKARIYSTLEFKALPLLPWVDVAQLHRPSQIGTGLATLLGHQEVHSYDTRGDAKLLSPDGYYRRQGWDAYALNLSGAGVWAAWDSTGLANPETGWNPFVGQRERDFGLIYAAPDGCAWPSVRLLAWARGLEENRLLRQCAKRLPAGRVDHLVRTVLDTGDFSEATRAVTEVAEGCR